MKRTLLALSAVILSASPALSAPLRLHDPDAVKPVDPPAPPVLPPTPAPTPPVYHPPTPVYPPSPPVYYPPAPPMPPYPTYPTDWVSRRVYVNGYGTRSVEYRTFSDGTRTIVVWGPKGKEKLKNVNCWNNTFTAPKNKNPFRFQYETVKIVCRY